MFVQELPMELSRNDSEALRLDGIYLHQDSLGVVDLIYLYQNGTLLSRGSVLLADLETKLAQLDVSTYEKYKSMKFLWGKYSIENKAIQFEKFAPTDKPYRAFRRTGQILNDSTFVMDQYSNISGAGLREINEIYRFRKTISKPDSKNKWIESGDTE